MGQICSTHSFTYCLWSLSPTVTEQKTLADPQNWKYLFSGHFYFLILFSSMVPTHFNPLYTLILFLINIANIDSTVNGHHCQAKCYENHWNTVVTNTNTVITLRNFNMLVQSWSCWSPMLWGLLWSRSSHLGVIYVSTWLDHGAQIFDQTIFCLFL